MKCYYDDKKDAQGQCQICGRFASRKYSRIIDSKFVCIECAHNGQEGIIDWIERYLNEKSIGQCDQCGKALYPISDYDEFRLLCEVSNTEQSYKDRFKLFRESGNAHYCSTCLAVQERIKYEKKNPIMAVYLPDEDEDN